MKLPLWMHVNHSALLLVSFVYLWETCAILQFVLPPMGGRCRFKVKSSVEVYPKQVATSSQDKHSERDNLILSEVWGIGEACWFESHRWSPVPRTRPLPSHWLPVSCSHLTKIDPKMSSEWLSGLFTHPLFYIFSTPLVLYMSYLQNINSFHQKCTTHFWTQQAEFFRRAPLTSLSTHHPPHIICKMGNYRAASVLLWLLLHCIRVPGVCF